MATITHGGTLPDSAGKADFYAIIDNGTITAIGKDDIAGAAGIEDSKLATITTAGKVNTSALTTTSAAQGDVFFYDGSNWVRLGAGTAGDILKSGGAAADVTWLTTLPIANGGSGTTGDSIVKGWINFTDGVTNNDSYNVDSGTPLVDNGTGDYTINWDTNFGSADYAVSVACGDTGGTAVLATLHYGAAPLAAGTTRVNTWSTGFGATDADVVCVIAIGDR